MTHDKLYRTVLSSRIAGAFASRPRLVAFLALMVLLVAMQGGVAALGDGSDCTFCVGTQDNETSNTGP
jgi:hypothetical protein